MNVDDQKRIKLAKEINVEPQTIDQWLDSFQGRDTTDPYDRLMIKEIQMLDYIGKLEKKLKRNKKRMEQEDEIEDLKNKRIIDITVEEFIKVLAFELSSNEKKPSYSYKGLRGIMEIFKCARSKAMNIKASGVIDDACIQNGNSFLIDKDLALSLMKDHENKEE